MRTKGRYLNLEVLSNGLNVTLTPEGREELNDRDLLGVPDHSVFIDLFEDYWTNGWTCLHAEQIGALTGCEIIIGPDVQFDDQGEVTNAGDVYWHERYQV
jgi:hypothetical protein